MLHSPGSLKRWLVTVSAALPCIIIYITVISLPLTVAQNLHLSAAQTTSWILVAYGLPSLLSIPLAWRYQQPIILTPNLFAIIIYASLVGQLSYPEIIGASIVAGVIVILISLLGLTSWLVAWVPEPVVYGLLAGAVMPYVFGLFTLLGNGPVVIGGAFLAYLLGRLFLRDRLPAVLPALVVGLVAAAATGQLGQAPPRLTLPDTVVTLPVFSLHGILTATPLLVIATTLQANVPSIVFMRGQGYHPPNRVIDTVSGLGTLLGSVLGPMAVSIPLPFMPLLAGPEAGEPHLRHRSVYIVSAAGILLAAGATIATHIPAVIPASLLAAMIGLSMIGALTTALKQITCGPLLLGPIFAFAVALSKISLFGFGSYFWSLVIGMGISFLLERDKLGLLRVHETPEGSLAR